MANARTNQANNLTGLIVVCSFLKRIKNISPLKNKFALSDQNSDQQKNSGRKTTAPVTAEKQAQKKAVRYAVLYGLGYGLAIILILALIAPSIREIGFYFIPQKKIYFNFSKHNLRQLKTLLLKNERKVAGLQNRFGRLTPNEPYLIIDSSENFVFLKNKNKLLHQSICSTGSYTLLKAAGGKEKWIFKTPRGRFYVQSKLKDPVWRMPDWAFVEEGLPVPAAHASERFEYGVLGDYALDIGDGYLIHGTLYQRFLGMPVTHGCVRLGDKELKIVYHYLAVGSKVYIY